MLSSRLRTQAKGCGCVSHIVLPRVRNARGVSLVPVPVPVPVREIKQAQQSRQVRMSAASNASNAATPEESKAGATTSQAVFNLCNLMMGVGILSLPFALKSSGWAGIGLLWLMGFICNYTGKALVEIHAEVSKIYSTRTKIGYEDYAEATFGPIGRAIISSIMYIELFGTCALLFILEGDNMFNLLGTKFFESSRGYMLAAACLMIPTVWLPNLKSLSVLGIFGLTATVSVTATVTYTLLSGNFPAGAVTSAAQISTLPLVFGIMAFCYSGHGVFPSIQASMAKPQDFPKALNYAFLIVAALCTFMGGAGYYMYGPAALDLVIFNLPEGLLAKLCACLILVNPLAKFALTMEPVANAAVNAVTRGAEPANFTRAAIRTVVAVAMLVSACFVPYLALVMALIGSFMTITISIIFPALAHIKLFHKSLGAGRLAWDYFVVAMGLTCAGLGTFSALSSMAAKFATGA